MVCIAISPLIQHSPDMLAKEIGANIHSARKGRGWSLQCLAAKVEPKTSYQQIARLEKGDRTLTVQWVERIAKALETDPLDLIIPDRERAQGFTLDEQVANEVARTLAEVALQGEEPENGTVQAISLLLQELTATFAEHPRAASDAQVVRPLLTLASKRFAPSAN